MFNSKKLKKIREQSSLVFHSQLLNALNPLERYEFLQLCHRRKYKEGEYIYYQNDPGTGLYLIESGRVELVYEPDEDEKDPLTYTLEAPHSFGTLSIGYELRRLSSARCSSDATLLGFFNPDFSTLKDRHPRIAVKLLEQLSLIALKQLERTTQHLTQVSGADEAFRILIQSYKNDGRHS